MSLTRSRAVIELGKRLVEQLDAEDDLLASWMAHDIAQRIQAAEEATFEAKAAAQDSCARAVLELWRHRNALPGRLRPFGELEPVLRALASLDVNREDYRYYPQALREAATEEADEDTKQWIELAFGIDYTARLLIQFALRTAAQRSASEAQSWVELARKAGADEGVEGPFVKFVLRGNDPDEPDKRTDAISDKLIRMEAFAGLATALMTDLRSQLGTQEDKGSNSNS